MIDMMFVLSIFKNKTYCLFVLFILSLSTTSCTSIGRIISTPNYSHHSVDKILLNLPIKTILVMIRLAKWIVAVF